MLTSVGKRTISFYSEVADMNIGLDVSHLLMPCLAHSSAVHLTHSIEVPSINARDRLRTCLIIEFRIF